ncbi:MAG: NAD-dependent epimerase/dehydratase family protein [Butyricicoccus sp.]
MGKRVLVVGGTYFFGRVFCLLTEQEGKDYELTLLNRGRFSMAHLPCVKAEYHCDRHDRAALAALPEQDYDAVVDFCAYQPGEVRTLLEALPGRVGQYVLISTCDVYDRRCRGAKDEQTPLLTERHPGEIGDYVYHKMQLEHESCEVCDRLGIPRTVLRPAFLYGPFNYAPRESWYVKTIVSGQPVPVPDTAEGKFQFVYVGDAAHAIMCAIEQERAKGREYNLSAPEVLDYPGYMETLRRAGEWEFATRAVSLRQIAQERIPLPFPLTEEESELFDGSRIVRELGLQYTDFLTGMRRTVKAFLEVYAG